jgi:hypothetical protein
VMSERNERVRSGKVVRENRFLVRHRVLQFAVECESEEDARVVRIALETAYDPILISPSAGEPR